jgi:hypothetical protein
MESHREIEKFAVTFCYGHLLQCHIRCMGKQADFRTATAPMSKLHGDSIQLLRGK